MTSTQDQADGSVRGRQRSFLVRAPRSGIARPQLSRSRPASDFSGRAHEQAAANWPRIALLTPYTGGNLGDAAIQDATIVNLRHRLSDVEFSGISLNCDNFVDRHGNSSFALCASERGFYRMWRGKITDPSRCGEDRSRLKGEQNSSLASIKQALKRVPAVGWCLKTIHSFGRRLCNETLHCVRGFHFLQDKNLLIVSGGGQLDEEWGGPWGHPFALFKWAVLARLARVPYAIASVGACKVSSRTCRVFVSAALRLARYRSYRDQNTREVAAQLLQRCAADSIVPDMAFSLPFSELARLASVPPISRGRPVVALSPIAYAKPEIWVEGNAVLYDRYLQEMARVVSQLLHRDYSLVIVWSSLGDDEQVVPEILERLDEVSKQRAARQVHIPGIRTWKDLVASLRDADFLIASRLHSVILGLLTRTPTVSISFDPKVDWLMEDLRQTEYLLNIRDFTADGVIELLHLLESRRNAIVKQIASYLRSTLSASGLQYDTLADLAVAGQRCRA